MAKKPLTLMLDFELSTGVRHATAAIAAAGPTAAPRRQCRLYAAHTLFPALQLQKSRPSSRRKRARTMLCTSEAPSTKRAARAAR